MDCRCEVLWGRVGSHRKGDKLDLSETEADRLHKMGAVRVLFKTGAEPEPVTEASGPDIPAAAPYPNALRAPAPSRSDSAVRRAGRPKK
jgi:hypothetical protein